MMPHPRLPSVSDYVPLSWSIALPACAMIFLLIGVAIGRSCVPFACPIGKNEFKAKMTICEDGKAYALVVQPESMMPIPTSTIAVERDEP